MASLAVSVSILTRSSLGRKWKTAFLSTPRPLRHSTARSWTHFLLYERRLTLQDLIFHIPNVPSTTHIIHPSLVRHLLHFLTLAHSTRSLRAMNRILPGLRDGRHLATTRRRCPGSAL